MLKVELVANVPHYMYTAQILHALGCLGHYTTGPCALDSEAWLRTAGPLKKLWTQRRLENVPHQLVKRLWFPEIVQKGIKKIGGSTELSNWSHNEIFARRAASRLEDCDAIHFVHSVGLKLAMKAKKNGAKIICDMREEHPKFQHDILSEEFANSEFRIPFQAPAIPIGYSRKSLLQTLYFALPFTRKGASPIEEFRSKN